jgi:hypothetical protein
MLPFGVTIPATVPQGSEIPEGLMNNPVYDNDPVNVVPVAVASAKQFQCVSSGYHYGGVSQLPPMSE